MHTAKLEIENSSFTCNFPQFCHIMMWKDGFLAEIYVGGIS